MAGTRSSSKGSKGSKATFSVRSVRTKEDRKRPSVFHRLKQGESFKAISLFEPDPELDDNPGYFEYYDHYDQQANQYVPCAGDRCPFCAANHNPSTRAITAWYFPDADAKERIKLFTMNFSTINEVTDEAEEDGGALGKKVRIKRMDDRGDYRVRILTDKPLGKKEIKAALKELAEMFPNGLEGEVERQLKVQMERLRALDAMEDDDDEDEDDEPKARRGKAIEESDDDEDDDDDSDDDDDDDDDSDDDSDEDDDEDDDDDDDAEESDDDDSDDDDDDSDDDDSEEEAEEEETELSGVFEIQKASEREETLDVKSEDGTKVKLYAGQGMTIDYDAMKKGVNVTVKAEKDDEGDWVMTKLSVKKDSSKKESSKKGKKGGKK